MNNQDILFPEHELSKRGFVITNRFFENINSKGEKCSSDEGICVEISFVKKPDGENWPSYTDLISFVKYGSVAYFSDYRYEKVYPMEYTKNTMIVQLLPD